MELLTGNEASALGGIKAGVRFFAGYPITPSTEIAEIMALELPRAGGVFIQMEDEIAAITAIVGASAAGAKSMTSTSGPGFSLMQEGIGYACMVEVPCVIVNVQRGGPATGLPTKVAQGDLMAARWGTHGDHPAVSLAPATIYECFELTVKALEIAERLRMPVIVLMDEIVGHLSEKADLPESVPVFERKIPRVQPEDYHHYGDDTNYDAPIASFGQGFRIHLSGLTHRSDGFPTNKPEEIAWKMERLRKKIDDNRDWLVDIEHCNLDDAETVLVSFGSAARSAKEARRIAAAAGKKIGSIRLRMVWPFPEQPLRELLKNAKRIVVPEMNQGQLIHEIRRTVGLGIKLDGVNRVDGEMITPDEILGVL